MSLDGFGIFDRPKVQLLLKQPFFATLLLKMPFKEVDSLLGIAGQDTLACTDGKQLILNTKLCAKLNEKEITGLLCHEVLHPALGHLWRIGGREPGLWNSACDYVINLMVTDSGMEIPKGGCLDEQYRDMSTEAVYDKLLQKSGKGAKGVGGTQFEDMSGQTFKDPGKGNQKGGSFSVKGQQSGQTLSKEEQEELEEQWKQALTEAVMAGKLAGKLPGGMENLLDELLNPQLPWTVLLANIASETNRDDYSFKRPNRRYVADDIYLPILSSEAGKASVIVDTSGSMSISELRDGFSEIHGILETSNINAIRLMMIDTEVTYDEWIESDDPIPNFVKGRGGTELAPAFQRLAEDFENEIGIVICITDGYMDFENLLKPNCPIIFLLTEDSIPVEDVPFGMVYKLDRNKKR